MLRQFLIGLQSSPLALRQLFVKGNRWMILLPLPIGIVFLVLSLWLLYDPLTALLLDLFPDYLAFLKFLLLPLLILVIFVLLFTLCLPLINIMLAPVYVLIARRLITEAGLIIVPLDESIGMWQRLRTLAAGEIHKFSTMIKVADPRRYPVSHPGGAGDYLTAVVCCLCLVFGVGVYRFSVVVVGVITGGSARVSASSRGGDIGTRCRDFGDDADSGG